MVQQGQYFEFKGKNIFTLKPNISKKVAVTKITSSFSACLETIHKQAKLRTEFGRTTQNREERTLVLRVLTRKGYGLSFEKI